MTPLVTEFQPPEGLQPHEAPFLLGEDDEKVRSLRAFMTASLELVDMQVLSLPAGAKRPVVTERPDVALTPFQRFLTSTMAAGSAQGQTDDAEALIKKRLAELGWCDAASGRLSPDGLAARDTLRGYRDYLREAMSDRLHMAAVEGALDRETEFAAGVGIIEIANLMRAVSIRLGDVPTGAAGAAYALLGGRISEQHADASRRRGHPILALAAAIAAFTLVGFIIFLVVAVILVVISALLQGNVHVTIGP